MPLQDFVRLESPLFGYGRGSLAFSSSPLDSATLGLPPLLHSFVHLSLSVSLLDTATCGSLVSTHGLVRPGSALFPLEYSSCGSSLFLRSFVHPDPALLACDVATLGSLMLLQSLAQPNFSVSVPGVAWFGSMSFPLDNAQLDFSPFLRSFARLDFVPSVYLFAAMGSLPPAQNHVRIELLSPFIGIQCAGPVFFLPLIEATTFGPALLLHSFGQLGFLSFALDYASFGFTVLLLGQNSSFKVFQFAVVHVGIWIE